MLITKISTFSGKTNSREINVASEDFTTEEYNKLSYYDKEFLRTGMTPEEIDQQDEDNLSKSENRYHR